MRILFSSSFVYKSHNGAAIFAQLFLKWAKKNKHEIDVISQEKNEAFIEVDLQSSGHPLFYIRNISKAIYNKIKTLDYKSYDIIYFNNVLEAAETTKKLDHRNIMAFLHDSQYMNDVYPHQTFKRRLYRQILHRIEKKTISRLYKVHTNSEQMLNQIHSIYNCPINKLKYLYFSSLDLHPKVKIPHSKFTILFIKTNYISGGLFTLLDAVNKIKFPIEVIAVGPSEKDHKLIKNKYPSISIKLYSYKTRSEIGVLFAQSDVFITPAFTEPMGIGNLEAMKMDLPVIGNDIEGIGEIAKKSNAILLMRKNNSEDLAKQINELKTNGKLKRNLIQNGRKFVVEHLSEKVIFNNLSSLIEE